MAVSRKQELYGQILFWVLPMLRNRESWPWWRRLRSWYPDTELVHNLYDKVLEPSFTEQDLHWLNTQARIFIERGERSACYAAVKPLICELFGLVPVELRTRLAWSRPAL